MKTTLLAVFTALSINCALAQNFTEIGQYEFKTTESYKAQEQNVLLCANYLFNNPADFGELNRLNSTQFIVKWMTGTPDYTFALGEEVLELTKGNEDLLGLYMAAMSKVVIEHEGDPLSNEAIYEQSKALLVDYCSNPDNNIKPSKKIKRIMKGKDS